MKLWVGLEVKLVLELEVVVLARALFHPQVERTD